MKSVVESLEINPIIAALPHIEMPDILLSAPIEVVFILSGNILEIRERVGILKDNGKKVFVHADLIEGLGRDLPAVDFIQKEVKPDGILSTRSNLLKHAKNIGLVTVQRLFLVDSLSFESGIKMVKSYEPDFVEVMPGIIPRAIGELRSNIRQPIIAGGMITHKDDIIQAIKAGGLAVSTSKSSLWELE
jgi:glycerol uptake operon antiterminator